MMNFGWGGMVIGGVVILLVWIVIVGLTVWAVSRLFKTGPGSSGTGGGGEGSLSALEIAKRRYAKGEITREQFEQLKKDLS